MMKDKWLISDPNYLPTFFLQICKNHKLPWVEWAYYTMGLIRHNFCHCSVTGKMREMSVPTVAFGSVYRFEYTHHSLCSMPMASSTQRITINNRYSILKTQKYKSSPKCGNCSQRRPRFHYWGPLTLSECVCDHHCFYLSYFLSPSPQILHNIRSTLQHSLVQGLSQCFIPLWEGAASSQINSLGSCIHISASAQQPGEMHNDVCHHLM